MFPMSAARSVSCLDRRCSSLSVKKSAVGVLLKIQVQTECDLREERASGHEDVGV